MLGYSKSRLFESFEGEKTRVDCSKEWVFCGLFLLI